MEQDTGQKESAVKINATDVMQSFEHFEESAKAGFTTQEESLVVYGKFIATAANFFQQPGVEKLPETRSLVNRLFYQYEFTASVPLEFFLRVKDGLNKNVLANGSTPRGDKTWNSELSLIKSETLKEAGVAWQDYTKERGLRERLEQMAQENLGFEEETNLLIDITSIEERRQFIQDQTIDVLSRDEDIRSDLALVNRYKEALKQAQQKEILADAVRIRGLLSAHGEFLQRQDGSLIDELYARSASGQQEKVRAMLVDLEAQAKNPDFIWQRFVNKGYVSKEVVDSFDKIVTLTELQETANILSEYSKSAKAKHLLPFLQKGISAGLLMEMVEGRYDLPDNLIARHIDSLIHFSDVYEEQLSQKQPWSLKKKLVTSAAVAAAVGIMASTPYIIDRMNSSEDPSQSQTEQILEEHEEQNLEEQQEDLKDQKSKVQRGKSTGESTEESGPPSLGNRDSIKPVNDSVEGFKKGKETVFWSLSGNNLTGFYRNSTASYFNPNKEWVINKGFTPLDTTKLSQRAADITLSGKLLATNTTATIPSRDNYLLSLNGFRAEGITGPVNFSRRADENYIMHFSPEDVGKVINISYSLDKSDRSTLLPPTEKELQDMSKKIVDVSELPGYSYGVKPFVTDLGQDSSLSKTDKAKKLEKYVKDELVYSLDPYYSDRYHQEKDNKGFIKAIFDHEKVDCDVANTALVALLRSIDIPSRMAYGFANTGILDKDNRNLVGSEGHGWVESYVDGKWISLDGTPTRMDSSTQRELKKLGLEGGDLGLKEWNDWGDWGGFKEPLTWTGVAVLGGILASELLGAGALGVSALLKRRNEKVARRLSEELEDRAKKYFGNHSYPEIVDNHQGKMSKSYKIPSGVKKILLPHGLPAVITEADRAAFLRRLSHIYPKGSLTTRETSQPDTLEFFTKVLGHGEKETKKRLYDDAYSDARRQFASGFYDIEDEIQEELHVSRSFVFTCDIHLLKKLFDKKLPQDEQQFNQRKTEVISSLYARYQKERTKAVGRKDNILLPPDITMEEFGKSMERLIGFRSVERQMEVAHGKALKSVSRNWKQKLLMPREIV